MNTRFIFEVLNDGKLVCEFADHMAKSEELQNIVNNNDVKIREREVSAEFYQEIVDDGGLIKYNC